MMVNFQIYNKNEGGPTKLLFNTFWAAWNFQKPQSKLRVANPNLLFADA